MMLESDCVVVRHGRLNWVDELSVQHMMKNDDMKYVAGTKPLWRYSSVNDPEILSSTMGNRETDNISHRQC